MAILEPCDFRAGVSHMASIDGLEIAPEKVAHVIIKAREYNAKVGAWNDNPEEGDAAEDPSAILEDFAGDPTRAEITGFIAALNDDEQAHLVALAWIGRGTFEPEELDEAVETAKTERTNSTAKLSAGPAAALRLSRGRSARSWATPSRTSKATCSRPRSLRILNPKGMLVSLISRDLRKPSTSAACVCGGCTG